MLARSCTINADAKILNTFHEILRLTLILLLLLSIPFISCELYGGEVPSPCKQCSRGYQNTERAKVPIRGSNENARGLRKSSDKAQQQRPFLLVVCRCCGTQKAKVPIKVPITT